MEKERVSIIQGKMPILLLCPHGYQDDDENTPFFTEKLAEFTNGYAVINRGWERNPTVDVFNNKANCNDVNHCNEDVVREEFFDPIMKYKNRILKNYDLCWIYIIHGMADYHEKIAGGRMDMVVGYGAGKPDSYSCELWRKNYFIWSLWKNSIFAHEGKKGGEMSGWARSNVNQLFRKWFVNQRVQSLQLEIIHKLRKDETIAEIAAHIISDTMIAATMQNSWHGDPAFEIKEY